MSFSKRTTIEQVEEGTALAPKFDQEGLIPCVTTAAESGEVLMLGYMNSEALIKTIETGEAHYWSRSRKILWHKGANSGLVQRVIEMRIDDDQDAIWLRVSVAGNGASCHVGYKSCFYRQILVGTKSVLSEAVTSEMPSNNMLAFTEHTKVFDPIVVYGDVANPTQL